MGRSVCSWSPGVLGGVCPLALFCLSCEPVVGARGTSARASSQDRSWLWRKRSPLPASCSSLFKIFDRAREGVKQREREREKPKRENAADGQERHPPSSGSEGPGLAKVRRRPQAGCGWYSHSARPEGRQHARRDIVDYQQEQRPSRAPEGGVGVGRDPGGGRRYRRPRGPKAGSLPLFHEELYLQGLLVHYD